ncbi:MAG: TIGR03936 family radical SAM-associated protein [Vampirovibrionales bacterium]|nr:TIGR03936 family radical SAM-associated protein [Vampirovibrionales bacterium]
MTPTVINTPQSGKMRPEGSLAQSAFMRQSCMQRVVSELPIDERYLQQAILPNVFKPGRYLGLEQGAARKSWYENKGHHVKARMALAFPDLYEIGISNYGLKLLYSIVNAHPDYLCDRVYAPAHDLKQKLAEHQIPLWGVESMMPLGSFDMLAVSLQYELNYTSIFGLLEAAGIPFYRTDREGLPSERLANTGLAISNDFSHVASEALQDDTNGTDNAKSSLKAFPILLAGGPGATNPLPLAPFIDGFMIGDGEEVMVDALDVITEGKQKGWTRAQVIEALSNVDGIYVPAHPKKTYKRIVDISQQTVELAPLIPAIQAVHDRAVVEARRGCDRMCRFCQPGFINLPAREQNIDKIAEMALKEIEKTGYEECSLLSLSIADYSDLRPLVMNVAESLKTKNANLALPSQRADRFNLDVAEAVQQVRKSTLTFAPEAGTPRLRDVINKNLSDADIERAVTTAYKAGWHKVKLYFIIGLPTETDEDLIGIVQMVKRLQALCAEIAKEKGATGKHYGRAKKLEVNITLSNFVPKPHTPFQWHPQASLETLQQKIDFMRDQFRGAKGVKVNCTTPIISKMEAVIGRGDERLAPVLLEAYQNGAYLDAWEDLANFDALRAAFTAHGYDIDQLSQFSNAPKRSEESVLPLTDEPLAWDIIDVGLEKSWLKTEYEKALKAASTEACFDACNTCGVCATFGTWPVFSEKSEKAVLPGYAERQAAEPSLPAVAPPSRTPVRVFSSGQYECVQKLRVTLEKRGKLRFLSHLDWLRMLYRAVSQTGWSLTMSQGFNPKPKISVGTPLPLFWEGENELLDVALSQNLAGQTPEQLLTRLNQFLPEGGKAKAIQMIAPEAKSIDKITRQFIYEVRPNGPLSAEQVAVLNGVMTSNEPILWQARSDAEETSSNKPLSESMNLRPWLAGVEGTQECVTLTLNWLKTEPQPIWAKPQWVLESLLGAEAGVLTWRYTRKQLVS